MSVLHRSIARASAFTRDVGGNVALLAAILMLPAVGGAAVAVDYARQSRAHSDLQNVLDAAALAGAQGDPSTWVAKANAHFDAAIRNSEVRDVARSFEVQGQTLKGTAEAHVAASFAAVFSLTRLDVRVETEVTRAADGKACIILLDPAARQSFLVNSGADIVGRECEIHVHSTAVPAAIVNAGTTLDVRKVCIKGREIIKNSQDPMPIELGCEPAPDPHVGRLPQPPVGACTNTRQVYDPPSNGIHVMPANSVWCDVIFNGSPTIEFQPGLHVVKGRMIVNANSRIRGNGVTFYFPDVDSEIRANGGIEATLAAPTSGPYAGILMYEKSQPAGFAPRRQYVFNGSRGERLEGLIYLPYRDATYNSQSTVQASRLQMIFNTLIVNDVNWKVEPDPRWVNGSGASSSFFIRK